MRTQKFFTCNTYDFSPGKPISPFLLAFVTNLSLKHYYRKIKLNYLLTFDLSTYVKKNKNKFRFPYCMVALLFIKRTSIQTKNKWGEEFRNL